VRRRGAQAAVGARLPVQGQRKGESGKEPAATGDGKEAGGKEAGAKEAGGTEKGGKGDAKEPAAKKTDAGAGGDGAKPSKPAAAEAS
jgi:hypothetical protein